MNPSTNHDFSRLAASVKVSIDEDLLTVLLDLLRQGVSPEALYSFLKKAETESSLGRRLIKQNKSKNCEERNRKARSEIIIGGCADKNDREEEKRV